MVDMWLHHFPPFGIGQREVTVMLVVLFLLFGHRLPRIMRDLGQPFLRGPWDGFV